MSKEECIEVLKSVPYVSLASSVGDQPDVRHIDGLFDEETGTILFAANRKSPKVAQFAQNNKVAFISAPSQQGAFVRVKHAVVAEADVPFESIKDAMVAKRPTAAGLMNMISQDPVVYRISFEEAVMSFHGQNEVVKF